ncbi:iron-sulfur cluster repair di-iron protein [Bacillus sp. V59.32b]|uniref:iron-sulfur cluster repair di-iron protein n=1 Tax=Bacillus sp. V59.32b TaxID=1758642 RepID=UPI000E3CA512|nr:iron-sulfur cluster repair di-iron protein [Bacillus sp. V59.32b]RFU60208.1 iron-sulfur cluster repair di-iron protein [Bacillus sp. V59.32b]
MNLPFTEEILVKDAVTVFPKSSDVFKLHRIDFCCGGNISIKAAAEERGLDASALMEQLSDKYAGQEDIELQTPEWEQAESTDLIETIIAKFHNPTIEEFKQLSPYVTKVSKVHGERHPELLRIRELFFALKEEMLEHMQKEEDIVFPLILDKQALVPKDVISRAILELENEHQKSGDILKEIRELTADFTPPEDACGTYRLVFNRLESLEDTTFKHIHLENHILFPRYTSV